MSLYSEKKIVRKTEADLDHLANGIAEPRQGGKDRDVGW